MKLLRVPSHITLAHHLLSVVPYARKPHQSEDLAPGLPTSICIFLVSVVVDAVSICARQQLSDPWVQPKG